MLQVADLVLLLVDASFGFEMEIFEFLNICQVTVLKFRCLVEPASSPLPRDNYHNLSLSHEFLVSFVYLSFFVLVFFLYLSFLSFSAANLSFCPS
jgi:hypothetical protein